SSSAERDVGTAVDMAARSTRGAADLIRGRRRIHSFEGSGGRQSTPTGDAVRPGSATVRRLLRRKGEMRSTAARRSICSLLVIATCAVLLVPAASRAAGESAGVTTVSSYCDGNAAQVFRPWGDLAHYAGLQNGGLENGSSPWLLRGGAGVVSGNEPYFISGNRGDSHSLLLPQGSTGYSGFVCFTITDWHLRFVMRNVGSSTGALRVQVVVPDFLGGL